MFFQDNKTFDDFLRFSNETASEMDVHTPPFELLRKVDEYCRTRLWNRELSAPYSAALLGVSGMWQIYGAARNVIQGQPSVIFSILRTALENACYSLEICADPKLEKVWLNRHVSNSQRQKCKNAFYKAPANARRRLTALQKEVGDWMHMMYESFLDNGAHPNVKSIYTHLTEKEATQEGYAKFTMHGLYPATAFELQKASIAVVETAVLVTLMLTLGLKGVNSADDFEAWSTLNDEKNGLADAMGLELSEDIFL